MGDQSTFVIVLTNEGAEVDENVTVETAVPTGLTITGSATTGGSYSEDTQTWTVPRIEAGTSDTLRVTVSVDAEGTYTHTASITDAERIDEDASDDADAAYITTDQAVTLTLAETFDKNNVAQGDTIVATLVLSNEGTTDAVYVPVTQELSDALTLLNVEVIDTIDAEYTPAPQAKSSAKVVRGPQGTWLVKRLDAGTQDTLRLVARVDQADEPVTASAQIGDLPQTNEADPADTQASASASSGAAVAAIRVFLEGAYQGDAMRTDLNTAGLVPTEQPYSNPAYDGTSLDYDGDESVDAAFFQNNPDVVDWVLVEVRTGAEAGSTVGTRAAFVKADGSVVGTDGTPNVVLPVDSGSYFVVLRHRNHLAAMTATAVDFAGGVGAVDLTTGDAFGDDARKSARRGCLWPLCRRGQHRRPDHGPGLQPVQCQHDAGRDGLPPSRLQP